MAKRSRQDKKHGNKPEYKPKAQLSEQAQEQARDIAGQVSPPGISKQQRREIQQAIEKGIEQYRREFNTRQRYANKQQKKQKAEPSTSVANISQEPQAAFNKVVLPWGLLILSWMGFGFYLFLGR